jgi:hypothetical protein
MKYYIVIYILIYFFIFIFFVFIFSYSTNLRSTSSTDVQSAIDSIEQKYIIREKKAANKTATQMSLLKNNLQDVTMNLTSRTEQYNELMLTSRSQTDLIETQTLEITHLTNQLKLLIDERNNVQSQLNDQDTHISTRKQQIQSLQSNYENNMNVQISTISKLEHKLMNVEKLYDDAMDRIGVLMNERDDLQIRLNVSNKKNMDLEIQIQLLRTQKLQSLNHIGSTSIYSQLKAERDREIRELEREKFETLKLKQYFELQIKTSDEKYENLLKEFETLQHAHSILQSSSSRTELSYRSQLQKYNYLEQSFNTIEK